jgi:hypothetical protein
MPHDFPAFIRTRIEFIVADFSFTDPAFTDSAFTDPTSNERNLF